MGKAKSFTEPRDYRGVFLYKNKPAKAVDRMFLSASGGWFFVEKLIQGIRKQLRCGEQLFLKRDYRMFR